MKNSFASRTLLLIAYCVPFAFLAVNGDGAHGTMLFYGVMAAGFAIACRGALKTGDTAIIYIGNALSFASSHGTAKLSGMEPMGHYFKPLTSHSLITAISVFAVIVQILAVIIYRRRKKTDEWESGT